MRTRRRITGGAMLLLVNIIFILSVSAMIATIPEELLSQTISESSLPDEDRSEHESEIPPDDNPADGAPVHNPQPGTAAVISRTISESAGSIASKEAFINNSSGIALDFGELMKVAPALAKKTKGPEVLIIHTHTTESYMPEGAASYDPDSYDARSLDEKENMVEVGRAFTAQLEKAGIKTLHDTCVNDYPEYNGAYTRTAKIIKSYLEKYPSIRVVIDVHRDSLTASDGTKYKIVAGEPNAAQVMIVAGSGAGGLKHENYKENLRLAILWQRQMSADYKDIARPVSFVKYRYNQHLTAGSLILEVGTDANSLPEAKNAAEKSAEALAKVLLTL